jgi:antitoxin (DNA-binding transcriptional repressor) of toxin-antitoxin stability system
VLCAIVFFASATAHNAQTTPDPAITALSVMGIVTDLKADTRQVIVTTAAGNQVTVTLGDRTVFMRIPPAKRRKTNSSRLRQLISRPATVCLPVVACLKIERACPRSSST